METLNNNGSGKILVANQTQSVRDANPARTWALFQNCSEIARMRLGVGVAASTEGGSLIVEPGGSRVFNAGTPDVVLQGAFHVLGSDVGAPYTFLEVIDE